VVVDYFVGLVLVVAGLYVKSAPTGAPHQAREGRVKEAQSA
jgi:hypothetical protein